MPATSDFDALVAAYADDLYRYARWLCRDPHLAEDLVQETLLRSWRGFGSLREAGAAKAWLLTTLRREFLRTCAPAQRRAHLSLDDDEQPLPDDALPRHLPRLDEALDAQRCLERLPEAYREVLILQIFFGYSTVELAGILETTESAVANRLLRARRALAEAGAPAADTKDAAPAGGAAVIPWPARAPRSQP